MTKRTRNILLGIIIFLIGVNIISLVVKRTGGDSSVNMAGRIKTSAVSVRINGTAIPSYDFKDMVYIAAQDLQLFNFVVSEDENEVSISNPEENYNVNEDYALSLSYIEDRTGASFPQRKTYLNGIEVPGYQADNYVIIPVNALDNIGECAKSDQANAIECTIAKADEAKSATNTQEVSVTPPTLAPNSANIIDADVANNKVIVLDPGHGKSSDSMSADERTAAGWTYNSDRGQWGEWRHWKTGTMWEECGGNGCSGRAPDGGSCWYPISNGDRETEPDLNLQNSLAAKKYLEEMGYVVRLTRASNSENPSITQRIKNCYPNGDISKAPDALAYVCIHSNAGGGSGSSYIALSGTYDQSGIPSDYAAKGNALGKAINSRIVSETSLSAFSGGRLDGMSELILFCKSPVICGYMEIGFFDNDSDLNILKTESDAIGKAIAEGINDYFED